MRRIKLTQNKVALVDDADYEELSKYKWHADYSKYNDSFYAVRMSPRKNGKHYRIYMAREILGLKRGDKRQADHIDHNTLDNCQNNIRICTQQENQRNRKSQLNSSSQFKGVCWDKESKKWYASMKINQKQKNLGRFVKEKDAALAYDKAAQKHHGEFACLNFRGNP